MWGNEMSIYVCLFLIAILSVLVSYILRILLLNM